MKFFTLLMGLFVYGLGFSVTQDNYQNQIQSWKVHESLKVNSEFKNLAWRNIGPVVQGGRVVAVRASRQDSTVLYVAYASGGVWKSIDNGISFSPITDELPSQIVGGFDVDPNDDNVLWLGTGENNSSRSSYGGMGIYRSGDAGKTWSYMGLGDTNRIGDILVDPTNSKRIYVAALGPLYSKGGNRGVFVSDDAGKTWNKTLSGNKTTGFVDLSIASNGDVYVSAWERERKAWDFSEAGEGSKLYKSTDNGNSWKVLEKGLPTGKYVGRIGVDVANSDSNIVYVVVDNQELLPENQWDMGDKAINPKRLKTMSRDSFLLQDKKLIERFLRDNNFPPEDTAEKIIEKVKNNKMQVSDLVNSLKDANSNLFTTDIKGLEVYRSDDAGEHFYKTHDKPLSNVVYTYGYYFGKIHVDPQDANTIYTMGVPLIKSTDGGKIWDSLYNPKVHVDYHEVWIDYSNSNHIIAANDGGVDESYDGGNHWRKLDFQPVGQFYTVTVDMQTPYNVYGGLQDNGTLKGSSQNQWQNGESWERLFGGDGMHINVDKDTVYAGFQFGNYYRLEDGKSTAIKPPNYINEKPLRYNWNTPVVLSNFNKEIIYYGANKLFRSFDKGDKWHPMSKDLTQSLKYGDVPFATITSISESPLEFGRLIVGTDDGMVWVTKDDGHTWKNVGKKLPKKLWVSRVVASKHNKNRLLVTLNNYRNDDIQAYVFSSDDFGKSWKSLTKKLPNEAVNVIKEDESNADLLYLGTDKGLYVSLNKGANWTTLGGNLPTVPVHDLVVHPRDNELIVATHGRSIWVTDVSPIQNYKDFKNKDVEIINVPEIKYKNAWGMRPTRWFNVKSDKNDSTFTLWSANQRKVQLQITDEQNHVIYKDEINLDKGVTLWHWDNKVDVNLALNAEQLTNEKEDKPLNKSLTPVAEGIRLGHDSYIQKGKYHLELINNQKSVIKDFTVK